MAIFTGLSLTLSECKCLCTICVALGYFQVTPLLEYCKAQQAQVDYCYGLRAFVFVPLGVE